MEEKPKEEDETFFDFILRYVQTIQKPSWPWPPCLDRPPWRIEPEVHPESANINKILAASMDFQRSTSSMKKLPEHVLLRNKGHVRNGVPLLDHIVSNACLETTSLMHFYLSAYLTHLDANHDAKLEFVFGIFSRPDIYNGLPTLTNHCWLTLNGRIIETAFVCKADQFYQMKLLHFFDEKGYFRYLIFISFVDLDMISCEF